MILVEDLEIKIEKLKKEKKCWGKRKTMKDNVLLSFEGGNAKLPSIRRTQTLSSFDEIIIDKPEKSISDASFKSSSIITENDSILVQTLKKNKIVQQIKKEVLEIELAMNKEY